MSTEARLHAEVLPLSPSAQEVPRYLQPRLSRVKDDSSKYCRGIKAPGLFHKQPFSFMLPGEPPAFTPGPRNPLWDKLNLCRFLGLVRGSGFSSAHKQPSIEAAIHHCACQEDSAVFSKQRINMPELMIMNGQWVCIGGWAGCSGRELGLVEDFATALPFTTTLPCRDTATGPVLS